jgi:HPt (histidine-containing phosphotransfer) domain-containing protein
MRCAGDEALAANVVTRFLARSPAEIEELAGAMEAGDIDSVVRLAHRLKGAAATLGAEPLRAQAARIEMMGRDGDISEAGTALGGLRREFEGLVRYAGGRFTLGEGRSGR